MWCVRERQYQLCVVRVCEDDYVESPDKSASGVMYMFKIIKLSEEPCWTLQMSSYASEEWGGTLTV